MPASIAPTRPRRAAVNDTARDCWTQLFQLLLGDRESLVAAWAESGLTPSQGNLLYFLKPGAPATMAALARFLGCHDSNVTGLVDRLEGRGLVERQNDPADRRVKLIALTEAGAAFREEALSRIYEPPPFIASLGVRDQKALRTILRRAVGSRSAESVSRRGA